MGIHQLCAVPYYWLLIRVNNQKQQFETPPYEKKSGDKVSNTNKGSMTGTKAKCKLSLLRSSQSGQAATIWARSLMRENRKQVRRWAGKVLDDGSNGRGRGHCRMPSGGTGEWKPLKQKIESINQARFLVESWAWSSKYLSSTTEGSNCPTQQTACVDWLSLCGIYCNLVARCVCFSPSTSKISCHLFIFVFFQSLYITQVVQSTSWNHFPFLCNLVRQLQYNVSDTFCSFT